jgi:hypothetical protein
MKNIIKTRIWKRTFQLFTQKMFDPIVQKKERINHKYFDMLMEKILPAIRRYIAKRLDHAIKNDLIPEGKYKVEDFIDELYIVAYDHIVEVQEDTHLYKWLLRKAKELMEDTIIEVDFDHTFFKNIDDYTKYEREEMVEKYSIDGNGDLVMEEELDDLSYAKNDYELEEAFIENATF